MHVCNLGWFIPFPSINEEFKITSGLSATRNITKIEKQNFNKNLVLFFIPSRIRNIILSDNFIKFKNFFGTYNRDDERMYYSSILMILG